LFPSYGRHAQGHHATVSLQERSQKKIKHAIKLKTSTAKIAQLLQPSLAFCFSLQPMTAYRPGVDGTRNAVIGCKLKQNANEGCNSCATVVQVLQDLFYVSLHVLFYL